MCGIAGIYDPRGLDDDSRDAVRRMARLMTHRGPDEVGFHDGSLSSLGIRRLRVQDLATGSQPIASETNGIHVVANAEIYGFEALKERLRECGHRFKTRSDVEVIVHLYQEYGLQMFEHLDGMFAFALWDEEHRRLLVARDRFGIKPLFYSHFAGGRLGFASELTPLLGLRGSSRDLDPVAIDRFFELSYIPHPLSVFAQVRKLPPACYLLAEPERFECVEYWKLPSGVQSLPQDEALYALDTAIAASVRRSMRSDVPLGAFLSGGLDSSTVVYHMAQTSRQPIKTFTVRFAEVEFDEGPQADAVARRLGTEHREVWVCPDSLRVVSRVQAHFGEPFADPSLVPTFLLSEAARECVVVALSGDGGDELFGGYETYCASLLAERTHVPEWLRRRSALLLSDAPFRSASAFRRLRKYLAGCNLPAHARHGSWRSVFSESERNALYTSEFLDLLAAHHPQETFGPWRGLFASSDDDTLAKCQYLDLKTYLPDNNLTKMDRMSMIHSLEVRVPLLNLPVAEAAWRVPQALRVKGLRTKVGLRLLMLQRLPDAVIAMRKRGLTPPMDRWLRGSMKPLLEETLSPDRIRRTRLLRQDAVESLMKAHLDGREDHSRHLWSLICFVAWHEWNALCGET